MRLIATAFLVLLLGACTEPAVTLDTVAARYVKLVLATGEIAPGYVDAYYGPEEWREAVRAEETTHEILLERARALREALAGIPRPADKLPALRHDYLATQLGALIAYLEMRGGKQLSFDAEARALYDATPPHFDAAHFDAILADIDALVPGDSPLAERVEAFRQQFVIPPDRLPAVFEAAIAECRARSLQHIALPANESFRIEYVTNKPWSGYNWYQGKAHSLIQVNTDLPIFLDRAVDLGCHEGYPGHHAYNALLESELADKRGWPEFTVYALFSPQSLIAEGSANYGIDLAFPGDQRLAFERDTLAPLAGIDTTNLDAYAALREKLAELSYAGNEAARAYLDGAMSRDEAVGWLVKYTLTSPERAAQRVDFIETYRSYVINYNLGRDLVRAYVERNATTPAERWRVFGELLGSPRLPSGLVEQEQ